MVVNGSMAGPRVLVFNFFAGMKPRGIPVYARELEVCFLRLGVEHRELRAPAWMARAPAMVQNLFFVLFEQVVAPLLARWHRCTWTVYPYNSGSLFDALTGRSVMVIHDLIPNRRDSRGLAARYIRVCQAWHAWLGRPVATVSRHTMRQLGRISRFERCDKYLWANPFYAFEAVLARQGARPVRPQKGMTLLLCSGIGPNKDYRGALKLLRRLPPQAGWQIRVLGFGDEAPLARRTLDLLPPAWRDRVHVLPRLSLDEIVAEFSGADVVWVHSRAEGFGRPVMEARMCGKPVVATDIGAFRQLRRFRHVHLYKDVDFERAVQGAVADARAGQCGRASAQAFNRQLEAEVGRLLARSDSAHRA
jgi:glycosyltransferase involved in cell wall biosynthesis